MMILIFLMWVQVAFKYIEITYVWETDIRKSQTNVHVNKMQPTNPNAHTYINGTDVQTDGCAVTQNTFLQ